MIQIRLFATLKDIAGTDRIELETDRPLPVREVFDQLVQRYPGLARYSTVVQKAVNEEYTDWEREVVSGDEVAFFPPVSGG
ncbi:MAG TPA: MoaD/ThiS family protein [Acidobacteriota bacterium]|nr:MoaD/ThiS family protein [Acidobacteriota bacterium]